MPTWITDVLTTALPYWPFITQVIVLWYLGQVAKKRLWTKANATKNRFYEEMRATLPIHPLVAGALWGAMYPWLPAVGFVTTRGGAINEGLLAAMVNICGFVGLEYYAAQKNITWILAILRDTVPDSNSMLPPPPDPAPPADKQ